MKNNKFAKLEKSAPKNKITLRNVWDFHVMRAAFSSLIVSPDVQLLRFHFLYTENVCLLRKQETLKIAWLPISHIPDVALLAGTVPRKNMKNVLASP